MIGTSGKMGRGGAAATKRTLHAPPINRARRPPMSGGPRGRAAAPSPPISAPVEESFGLVRENPLNFGMAIKLAPGLVEEIKRVEAQGGGARIKFDVNPNIPNGNVIRVGDKVFRFTWSREPGDLCDVYEERQSGEDGTELLVESGGTWRKLNVERELDESAKNHVKRRSEEAERKHKSRTSIVLDPQNPSIKNKVKTAAAESNSGRNFTNRKEPPSKKAKLNPPPGGLPSKPTYIPGLSTTTLSKGKISSGSPLPSQPDQNGGPVSSFGSGNLVKGNGDITNVAPTKNTNKSASSDKEMHNRLPNGTIHEKSKRKRNTEANPADLKSLVISLLQEHHPTGMSLKALEKATGDVMPNSTRKIEPILKQVAIYQAPGKYLLKSAVVKDGLNKPPSQNGSSQEVNRQQLPSLQTLPQPPAQDTSFPKKTPPNVEEEKQGELNSPLVHTMDITEKIDMLQDSPPQQHFSDRNTSGNSEGRASSSSDSGSDSDSSSSDSDSESHSRSPVGNSSDSDSSISSKQASDEEVDIMSSDDKVSNHKLLDPIQSHMNDEYVDIGTHEKQDDLVATDVIDIENDSPEDFLFNKASVEERENGSRKTCDRSESVAVKDSFPKVKPKRSRDGEHLDDRQRSRSQNLSHPVHSKPQMGSSPKEINARNPATNRLPVANGNGSVLGRKYSDLELGELREPIDGVIAPLPKKRKTEMNSDLSRGKPSNNVTADSGVKSSPQVSEPGLSNVPYVSSKKASAKSIRPPDHIGARSLHNKALETSAKSRFADGSLEASYKDDSRRMPINSAEHQHVPVQGVEPQITNGSKKQKPHVVGISNGRPIDATLTCNNGGGRKEKESSSDENGFLYTKYEKEEPELKGPIKDATMYKEYVKEYQEKYESYCSLNKIMEAYRDEFSKLGKDLEAYKVTDMKRYNDTLKQMRTSYHQSGERHKRQKKIFIILYKELKHLKQMIKDYAASCL